MKTTVAQNVHALIGKTPRVHSTCEIEEVEEEEVQEDSVLREEYRALEVMTVREERRKMVMKRRKMGMKMRMQRRSMTMRTMMRMQRRSMTMRTMTEIVYQYTDHIETIR